MEVSLSGHGLGLVFVWLLPLTVLPFFLFEGLWIWGGGGLWGGVGGLFWDGHGHGHTWREVGEEVYQCQLRGCVMCFCGMCRYYSMYGHVAKLAEEILKGANSVEGVEATLWQVQNPFFAPSFFSFLHFPVSSMNFLCWIVNCVLERKEG